MSLSTEKYQKTIATRKKRCGATRKLQFFLNSHLIHFYTKRIQYTKKTSDNEVQLSSLLSIKSGGCPEDCAYCPQSVRYKTHVENVPLMGLEEVLKG